MRTLRFIVDRQIIKQDPECDFNNIVPGTVEYLKAEFSFSSEWDNTIKVAAFYRNGHECTPQVLKDGRSCIIPEEALINRRFEIMLIGKNKKLKIITNKIEVIQNLSLIHI